MSIACISESIQGLRSPGQSFNNLLGISPERRSETTISSKDTTCKDDDLGRSQPMPPTNHSRLLRHARLTILTVYRRLFSVILLLNVVGVAVLSWEYDDWQSSPPLEHLATAAAANAMVTLLIRQEFMVNMLFRLCWLVPHSAPLRLRCLLAKVYEYGGVHSGAGVCCTIWFTLFTAFLTSRYIKDSQKEPATLCISYILLVSLFVVCAAAHPRFRSYSHNAFENIHRWVGYLSLAVFWAELGLFAKDDLDHSNPTIIVLPAFWFLLIATFLAILPWLQLRKVRVTPEKLSEHALRLHFDERTPLGGFGVKISSSPLTEWHSFASIPSRRVGESRSSILISNAGDWTKKAIQDPKSHYYLKGIPIAGVLGMAQAFRRVVVVTTGSGIGPCLAVVQDLRRTSCRVLWSTPNPLGTYGAEICSMVENVDRKAVIWNTRTQGRPDLVQMTWDLYKEEDAEAVFVISNAKLTRKIVYGMQSRGVPTFGPIWDS